MRLGVLGGTFNPIHVGHLILAHCAAVQLGLDRVLFLPAGDPWRKAGSGVLSGLHRATMVRLAIEGDERFGLDEREVRQEGPSYTSVTLSELRREAGDSSRLFFLLGEDALEDMAYWHEPEVILEMATLAVAPRLVTPVPAPPRHVKRKALELPPYERIDMPYIGISSTDLRARVSRGESLKYLVPDSVDRYIRENQLYR
ncbi:MAG TPA: nicotinate-nucleotide adenylyltransferase [Dehalococcoidia bacterium]|nr:nicotinate-nucleotide adenylyltransferase [Dehalococcoidia bacterium]